MKSAILISPKNLIIKDNAPVPVPGPGEVVVAVRAALTCGTDIKAYLRGHPKIPLPSPLGHEFAGDIYSAGEGITGLSVGTPVMAVHSAPCGTCPYCLIDQENLCSTIMDEKVLGAYAEYIKLPANIVKRNLFIKPERLSYAEAAMLEPLSCVVHGMKSVRHDINNVLIMGAGPVGLLHLMLHKAKGRKVIVAARNMARLVTAINLGADAVLNSAGPDFVSAVMDATGGLGADLAVEAAGSPELWEASPFLVRRGGSVLLFGGLAGGTRVCFDAARLHYDEITLMGAFHFTPADVKESFDLLASGEIKVSGLISGSYPLDGLQLAFDELIAGRGIKYAIIP